MEIKEEKSLEITEKYTKSGLTRVLRWFKSPTGKRRGAFN